MRLHVCHATRPQGDSDVPSITLRGASTITGIQAAAGPTTQFRTVHHFNFLCELHLAAIAAVAVAAAIAIVEKRQQYLNDDAL